MTIRKHQASLSKHSKIDLVCLNGYINQLIHHVLTEDQLLTPENAF